jgi:hypothetical protein
MFVNTVKGVRSVASRIASIALQTPVGTVFQSHRHGETLANLSMSLTLSGAGAIAATN